jgi:hypothetical protein
VHILFVGEFAQRFINKFRENFKNTPHILKNSIYTPVF